MTKIAALALLALTSAGCYSAHAPAAPESEPESHCWTSGERSGAARERCFADFAECTEDAIRWGGGPWACEPSECEAAADPWACGGGV